MTINSCAKNFIYNLTNSDFIEDKSLGLKYGGGSNHFEQPCIDTHLCVFHVLIPLAVRSQTTGTCDTIGGHYRR